MLVNILIHSPAHSVSLQLHDTARRALQPRAVNLYCAAKLINSELNVCLFELVPFDPH